MRGRPNAQRQLRRWQASKLARLTARHDISKSRPAHGPRQRRQLHAMLGRMWMMPEICDIIHSALPIERCPEYTALSLVFYIMIDRQNITTFWGLPHTNRGDTLLPFVKG